MDSAYGGVPDPHVTYLLLGASYVPFGSKLIIEGEFPYCRFFSVQVSPPFNGKEYCPLRGIGYSGTLILFKSLFINTTLMAKLRLQPQFQERGSFE